MKGIVLVVHVTLLKQKHNVELRWNEHINPTISLEPSRHLRSNMNHCCTWTVISNVPKNAKTRKNLETSYTALWKPGLY